MNKFKNMIQWSQKLITSWDLTEIWKKHACKIKINTDAASERCSLKTAAKYNEKNPDILAKYLNNTREEAHSQ